MAASGGAAATGYWYATLGSSDSEVGVGVQVGSDDSLYVNATGNNAMHAAKYSSAGALSWQRRLALASTPTDPRHLGIDSNNSIFFAFADATSAADSIFAVAYNSSGALQWQKRWNANSRGTLGGNAATVAYGSNIYVIGARVGQFAEAVGGNGTSWLTKAATSNGSVTWSNNTYQLDTGSVYGITVDSSENIFVAHEVDQDTTYNIAQLAVSKFNSSGSRLWTACFRGESYSAGSFTFYSSITARSIATDSSGNIYAVGNKVFNSGANSRPAIIKLNSTGTFQWIKGLGSSVGYFMGVTTDASGNVYACGYVGSTAVLISYDSSGNINWQRTWSGGVSDTFRSIDIDSNGDLCICGNTSSAGEGSNDIFLIKLPADGSLTGTYGNFTYAASTYTNATEVANAYSPSIGTYSQSVTVTNSSFSETAGSLVSDTTNL